MTTYNKSQMAAYEKHIQLPDWAKPIDPNSLDHLTLLQQLQLARVPFTSLGLHYSRYRILSTEPEDLFHKIVERGLGGYCMENNGLFQIVLRTYGFKVVGFGGRVSKKTQGINSDGYAPFGHMVNIVTLGSTRYLVDVGFGVNGPTRPLALEHERVTRGDMMPTQEFKLSYAKLPDHTDAAQRAWVYSYRQAGANANNVAAGADAWFPAYSFVEAEFLPADWALLNDAERSHPKSFFVQHMLAQRAVLSGELDGGDGRQRGEVVGSLVLMGNAIRRKIKGEEAEFVEEMGSEDERVRAMEKWFGFYLNDEERKAIRGMATDLGGWS